MPALWEPYSGDKDWAALTDCTADGPSGLLQCLVAAAAMMTVRAPSFSMTVIRIGNPTATAEALLAIVRQRAGVSMNDSTDAVVNAMRACRLEYVPSLDVEVLLASLKAPPLRTLAPASLKELALPDGVLSSVLALPCPRVVALLSDALSLLCGKRGNGGNSRWCFALFNALPHGAAVRLASNFQDVRRFAWYLKHRLPSSVELGTLVTSHAIALLRLFATHVNPAASRLATYMAAAFINTGLLLSTETALHAFPDVVSVQALEAAAGTCMLERRAGTTFDSPPYWDVIAVAHATVRGPTQAASLDVITYLLGPLTGDRRSTMHSKYVKQPWYVNSLLADACKLRGIQATWIACCLSIGFVNDDVTPPADGLAVSAPLPCACDRRGCVWSDTAVDVVAAVATVAPSVDPLVLQLLPRPLLMRSTSVVAERDDTDAGTGAARKRRCM